MTGFEVAMFGTAYIVGSLFACMFVDISAGYPAPRPRPYEFITWALLWPIGLPCKLLSLLVGACWAFWRAETKAADELNGGKP